MPSGRASLLPWRGGSKGRACPLWRGPFLCFTRKSGSTRKPAAKESDRAIDLFKFLGSKTTSMRSPFSALRCERSSTLARSKKQMIEYVDSPRRAFESCSKEFLSREFKEVKRHSSLFSLRERKFCSKASVSTPLPRVKNTEEDSVFLRSLSRSAMAYIRGGATCAKSEERESD